MGDRTNTIAKNTVALYVRSFFVLIISLYSSRLILQNLGITDFGIYNVVGGIIGMLGFLNTSMQSTYQRYFNVSLGEKDDKKLVVDFKTSLSIQLFLSAIILIVGETIGLWWLENKLVIPESRMIAAKWIYQVSIVSCILTTLSAPFGAMITAFEKMHIYAVISIVDALLKLLIVLTLPLFSYDKLITYSLLILAIAVFDFVFYTSYCKKTIPCATIMLSRDKNRLRQMTSFSGWSMFDTLTYTLRDTGVNIVLNMFFGPVVNAARGIAVQVSSSVYNFVSSFQTSFRPQLTQSYASGDRNFMENLYFSATKLSFFLLFIISVPLILEMNFVLKVWLGDNVPENAAIFTIISILISSVSTFGGPTTTIAQATGRIKSISLIVGSLNILILPIVYLFLSLGFGPISAFLVTLAMALLVQLLRLIITSRLANVSNRAYFVNVIWPVFRSSILAVVLPVLFVTIVHDSSFVRLLCTCIISVISCSTFIWILGLSKIEKDMVTQKITQLVHRR